MRTESDEHQPKSMTDGRSERNGSWQTICCCTVSSCSETWLFQGDEVCVCVCEVNWGDQRRGRTTPYKKPQAHDIVWFNGLKLVSTCVGVGWVGEGVCVCVCV